MIMDDLSPDYVLGKDGQKQDFRGCEWLSALWKGVYNNTVNKI